MKTLKQIEKEFDERFTFECGKTANLEKLLARPKPIPDEIFRILKDIKGDGEQVKQIKSFYNTEIKQILNEVKTELYRIRASIPLTGGLIARKKVKELLEKLEQI